MEEPDPNESPHPKAVFQSAGEAIANASMHKKGSWTSTMDDSATDESESTRTLFQSAGDTITSATACKKEARRSIGDRLKMRKSTPRPAMKGNGRKRFNASPSPSTKPDVKKALAEDDDGEGIRTSGFKKNLMEELDMVAASVESQGSKGSHDRLKEKSPEEVTPTCKELVLYSEQPKDGMGGEERPLEVGNPESQALEVPERLDPLNPDSTPAPATAQPSGGDNMTVDMGAEEMVHPRELACSVGVETKQTKGTIVNFPVLAIKTSLFEERQLVTLPILGSRDCCMEESHMQPKQSLSHLANLDSAEALDRISSQPLQQIEAGNMQGSNRVQAIIGVEYHNTEPTSEHAGSLGPNQEYLVHFPPLEKGRTKKLCSTFETGDASSLKGRPRHGQDTSGVVQHGVPNQAEKGPRGGASHVRQRLTIQSEQGERAATTTIDGGYPSQPTGTERPSHL